MRQGDVFSLGCYISNVDHVFGIAFRVFYDPHFLEVADGGTLVAGTIFEGFETQPSFGPIEGEAGFIAGLTIDQPLNLEDAPTVEAEQMLLQLKDFLKAIAQGTTELAFEAYALKNPNLEEINANWNFPEAFEIAAQGSVRLVIE